MKNDSSFPIYDVMNMWKQQSSYNPNMPIRFLPYSSKLYEKYIADHFGNAAIYGTKRLELPTPKMVVFYNATKDAPKEMVLRLSDSFSGKVEPDMDIRVRMININYDENKELIALCKPLNDYSWLVAEIRKNTTSEKMTLSDAIHRMPEGEIKKFLLANKSEVRDMMLTE